MLQSLTLTPRSRVLRKLGLADLVSTEFFDIDEGHRQHVQVQRTPASFDIDGLKIDAPGGVYHPSPDSSSLLFIRNIMGMNRPAWPRVLEIGVGSGAISLFVARRWASYVVATDISAPALATARANAARNGITLRLIESDLFAKVDERNFDLVVFNTPLIDKAPDDDEEGVNLCDPGGHILRRFASEVGGFLAPDGVAIFGLCNNTAYEALDGLDLVFQVIGFEMVGAGFWRSIVGARLPKR